jgi:2,5-furandicarboxylate decarboxylase 1
MAKNLRTYIDQLVHAMPEQIKSVNREVAPEFEITAMVEKLENRGESLAIMFHKVRGSKIPVLINVGASYERLALALNTNVGHMVEEYSKRESNYVGVKEVDSGPVKEVIIKNEDVDLNMLPITVHNEHDAGKYIAAGPAIIEDPDTKKQNLGLYRLQVQDKDQLGLFINPANHGYLLGERYKELGKPMEVAVVIGHHPAFLMASVSKLEGYGGELEVTGGLLSEPLEVVRGETVGLLVPSQAEIIIEGVVNPELKRNEGPFGEWPRYYTGTGDRWYIKVTAITMRKDAIYQDIMAAHDEHNMIGALPRMGSLYRRVREVLPTVKAINLPLSGGGRVRCYISLNKRSDGEPKQAAFAALVTEPNIKHIILVDDDIDVFNEKQVLWALSTRFQAHEDLIVMPNCIGSHLIPTAYDITKLKHGVMETKLIFDATKPAPPTPFPIKAEVPPAIAENINPEEYIEKFVW